ncbi:MAG: type II toxin-antitoxin system antitoxin SocA domain-containing protein [Gemmatimonadaceae bacterium]
MATISKNAQVLRLFAQAYAGRGIPRKRLVKLAYMADLLARQYLGRPVTDFIYIKDHYGPNARELPEVTEELTTHDLAQEYVERDGTFRSIRLRASHTPVVFDLTLGENEVLRYVMDNYLNMDLEEFVDDVVKVTDPFRAVQRQGEVIPMELVDGVKRKEIGFDLERILRAEQQAAEGNSVTLAEFVNELRTEITARHAE